MVGPERIYEQEPASSADAAELYYLVQLGLELYPHDEDDTSRAMTVAHYDQSTGFYDGYVQFEAVNPLDENDAAGVCAVIAVGELEAPADLTSHEEIKTAPHLHKVYYIFLENTRQIIKKSTDVSRPIEADSNELAAKLRSDNLENQLGLNIVTATEAGRLSVLLREALGLDDVNNASQQNHSEEKPHISLGLRLARWAGKLGIKRPKKD